MNRCPASKGQCSLLTAAIPVVALTALVCSPAHAADHFARLGPRQVRVGGEIGRRIDVTVQNNLLQIKVDQDFLKPFQDRKANGGFIGLGMFIDAAVRFAAHTQDPKVLALKTHVIDQAIKTQEPDGRRIRYYVPFECSRAYFPGDTYCCPNNYRRVVSELPGMIYYRARDGLAINLYAASSVKLDLESGVSLAVRQETDYPNSGRVVLCVEPAKPAEFTLRLRVPRWSREAKVAVNGQGVREPARGGAFLAIRRAWRPGDRVEIDLPMAWRLLKGRQNQAGRVAVMRGPMLFALSRQRNQELGAGDPRLITVSPSTLEGRSRTTRCDRAAWPAVWGRGSGAPGILRPRPICA